MVENSTAEFYVTNCNYYVEDCLQHFAFLVKNSKNFHTDIVDCVGMHADILTCSRISIAESSNEI